MAEVFSGTAVIATAGTAVQLRSTGNTVSGGNIVLMMIQQQQQDIG